MINKPMPILPLNPTKAQMREHIEKLEAQLLELRAYFDKPKSTGSPHKYWVSDSPYVGPEFAQAAKEKA